MSDILLLAAIVMLVLLFLKVPVYLAVLGGSMVYFALNPHVSAAVFAACIVIACGQTIIGTEKISLLAIPFFVCAGIFMNYTGVTKRIMDFCEVVTGRLPGGLAQVNVLLSTVMGGLSGSNIADAAMESKMMVPEMTKKGFSLEFPRNQLFAIAGVLNDHPVDPSRNRNDPLRMYCKRIHRKTVYVRSWGWGIALHHHDDISWGYLKKTWIW